MHDQNNRYGKKLIKLWLEEFGHDTLDQVRNLANLPFLYYHVAIMPAPSDRVKSRPDLTRGVGRQRDCSLDFE